jgi:hypothetical protein
MVDDWYIAKLGRALPVHDRVHEVDLRSDGEGTDDDRYDLRQLDERLDDDLTLEDVVRLLGVTALDARPVVAMDVGARTARSV